MPRGTSGIVKMADYIDNVVRVFCIILILAIFVAIIAQITLRTAGLSGTLWSEEVVKLMTIVTGFLGSTVAFKANAHTVMDSIIVRLSPKTSFRVSCLANLIVAALLVGIVIYGIRLAVKIPTETPVLRIRLSHVLTSVPLSGFLMLYYLALQWGADWKRGRGRVEDPGRVEGAL
jgi:TRAP-type C4-dicarboxylate transport system permease small subunit